MVDYSQITATPQNLRVAITQCGGKKTGSEYHFPDGRKMMVNNNRNNRVLAIDSKGHVLWSSTIKDVDFQSFMNFLEKK
jgi:hypothetical protein